MQAGASRLLVICRPLPKGQGPGASFSVVADNLLAATHSLLLQEAKKSGLRAGAAKRAAAEISQAATAAGWPLEAQGDKSDAARARKKVVVAPLSNKMGVVVPYDKDTELGYRKLHCTGAALRKLLAQIDASSGEARVGKQAGLDDLVSPDPEPNPDPKLKPKPKPNPNPNPNPNPKPNPNPDPDPTRRSLTTLSTGPPSLTTRATSAPRCNSGR